MDLAVENSKGERLTLTRNYNLEVIQVDGLTPAAAIISSTVVGTLDGEKFSASRTDKRNIVITVSFVREPERCRIQMYRFFQPNKPVRLFITTDTRDVYIDGYVESAEGNLFESGQKMQISVICPDPYFRLAAKAAGEIGHVIDMLEFPVVLPAEGIVFSEINTTGSSKVINEGDASTGVEIKLTASDIVSGITIYNTDTGESFSIPNISMAEGNEIIINTVNGRKKAIMNTGTGTVNIISELADHVDWFQIEPGVNTFSIECTSGGDNLKAEFFINEKYVGV